METYNPWSIVNLVFHHLAAQGLHPTLGGADPGEPAAELLKALGITPARDEKPDIQQQLADLRNAVLGDG